MGNTVSLSARALEVIDEPFADPRFARIAALIAEWHPQRLVVGRPVLDDGGPTATTPRVDKFVRQLIGRFGLPVELVDERYSSAEAASNLRAAGLSGPAVADDAEAAAIILRQYLDERGQR